MHGLPRLTTMTSQIVVTNSFHRPLLMNLVSLFQSTLDRKENIHLLIDRTVPFSLLPYYQASRKLFELFVIAPIC